MSEPTIIVALISLLGTLFGSLSGIVVSNKLTQFRLQELEEKLKKHNQVIERTFALEQRVEDLSEDVKQLQNKI